MATKYDRALVKLETAASAPLFKVYVDVDPVETERERERHMRETRGRGEFIVIPAFAADL